MTLVIYSPEGTNSKNVFVLDSINFVGLTDKQWDFYDKLAGGYTCRLTDSGFLISEGYTILRRDKS